MSSDDVLVRLRGVSKDYRSLRPLRIAELDLPPGRSLALLGFDQMMAEVLVDLITGAILPDNGEVIAFGKPTSSIGDPDGWLATLDQFGLLTDRAVLVEQFTVEQNLALPLSLAVDDMSPDVRARVADARDRSGARSTIFGDRLACWGPSSVLASASVVPSLSLPRCSLLNIRMRRSRADDASALAADIARIVDTRGMA